jgi:hypothetical protein
LFALSKTFIEGGTKFVTKLFEEMVKATDAIATGAKNLVLGIMEAIGKQTVEFAKGALDLVIKFGNELAGAIEKRTEELNAMGKRLAWAILDGVTLGMAGRIKGVIEAIISPFVSAKDQILSMFGVDSPSKLMIWLGKMIIDGLVIGIDNSAHKALDSVTDLGDGMITTFNEMIQQAGLAMNDMDEFNPTITPVLDLSQVQRDAKDMSTLVGAGTFMADLSLRQANTIAHTNDRTAEPVPVTSTQPTQVTFEQNNYSPTALSTNDIYRLTRSQIALAKEELKIP